MAGGRGAIVIYSEEEKLRNRILEALREAYPDRAYAMGDQVKRWFTRHWRNESFDPVAEDVRCRLCDVQRSFGVRRANMPWERTSIPVCSDCVRDARGTAEDERWPSRDMVRNEVLRALRATGDEDAAVFVQELASGFPDIVREEAACDLCKKTGPVAKGARARLCARCLVTIDDEIDRMQRR